MKFFTTKRFFQYYLPATLSLFMLVTIERGVQTDIGGYEKLYGFPFPYISSNYAFTHHFDVYILALLLDLLLYFTVIFLCFYLVYKIGITLNTHWALISVGVAICLFWICTFTMITFESTFKLTNDFDYKTEIRHLHLGSYPL
jgi:hypothetical protein